MIIVRLLGGLANQMFQYSTAKRLADKQHSELLLDLSSYAEDKLRAYELDCFDISGRAAQPQELEEFHAKHSIARKLSPFARRLGFPYLTTYINEIDHGFDPAILQLRGDRYLAGYWQSEKYFPSNRDVLLNEFTFKPKPSTKNQLLLDEIGNCNAVSLHVRRGDYVQNKTTNSFHGACDQVYYERAVETLLAKSSALKFFVFSDDPTWARDNIKINAPTVYVSNNPPDRGYEDLRLMSACKYFIIANSSFSWWGAWLSTYDKKIVIAPKHWFNDLTVNTNDILPSSWKTI